MSATRLSKEAEASFARKANIARELNTDAEEEQAFLQSLGGMVSMPQKVEQGTPRANSLTCLASNRTKRGQSALTRPVMMTRRKRPSRLQRRRKGRECTALERHPTRIRANVRLWDLEERHQACRANVCQAPASPLSVG